MKKLLLLISITISIALFTQCTSSKKATASASKVTYTSNIQPIVAEKCSPCHIPDKGGRVKALNTYEAVKGEADEIVRRIQLHPGDKGFMPMKHPRLSDSTINVFKEWQEAGLAE